MGIWGAIIGGAIGGAFGGVGGAALGFFLGASIRRPDDEEPDASDSSPPDDRPATWPRPVMSFAFGYTDSDHGRLVFIEASPEVPAGARLHLVAASALDHRPVAGRGEFRGDGGVFQIVVPCAGGRTATCFVPAGAVAGGDVVLSGVITLDGEWIGKTWTIRWPAFPQGIYSPVRRDYPLVLLAKRIAAADGLTRPEVAAIREHFRRKYRLDRAGTDVLRRILHAPAVDGGGYLARLYRIHYGAAWDDAHARAAMALLVSVATADGPATAEQLAQIRAAADALETDSTPWIREAERRRARASRNAGSSGGRRARTDSAGDTGGRRRAGRAVDVGAAYRILGLPDGADLAAVKRAYRMRIVDCHPDRMASLSRTAQRRAHARAVELNRAYEVLRAALGAAP
ncbi:MAG: hypothetical protein D6689_03200 [Deltaproteobacteria bacterium]|nr:MAG: hypothetical protein D6689_03200 [Deltaproteobacteria bacterium]